MIRCSFALDSGGGGDSKEASGGRRRGSATRRAPRGGEGFSAFEPSLRVFHFPRLPSLPTSPYEKRQIIHCLPVEFVHQTIAAFNSGSIDGAEACRLLDIGKIRLYQLRTLWLKNRQAFRIEASGCEQRGSCALRPLRRPCRRLPLCSLATMPVPSPAERPGLRTSSRHAGQRGCRHPIHLQLPGSPLRSPL